MKINNFKFLSFFIRQICKYYNVNFVDLEVKLSNNSELKDNCLYIQDQQDYSKNIFLLGSLYIKNLSKISGKDLNFSENDINQIINYLYISINNLLNDKTNLTEEGLSDEEITIQLNKSHFVFLIMRDIICPFYNIPLKNLDICYKSLPLIDLYEVNNKIYLNSKIKSQLLRDCILLVSAIKAHNLEIDVVTKDILYKKELNDRIFGLLKIAYDNDSLEEKFKNLLLILTDVSINYEEWNNIKTAQLSTNISTYDMAGGMWWFVGLIEKLLQPARGQNWDAHLQLKDYNQDLWDNIQKHKEKRGLPTLSYEELLSVQREMYKNKTDEVIQGLLSDARVW